MKGNSVDTGEFRDRGMYWAGGVCAIAAVAVVLVEATVILATGKLASSYDASEWFALFQKGRLVGLVDCAVLDVAVAVLLVPMFLGIYAAMKQQRPTAATLGLALALLGIAVYIPTNRAIFLLDASDLYASATTEAAKSMYIAQGQALMGLGRFGMFWSTGFLIMAVSMLVLSLAMLRDVAFGKAGALTGILAGSLILGNGISIAFVPVDVGWTSTILAGSGGLVSFAWWILVGLKLLALGRVGAQRSAPSSGPE